MGDGLQKLVELHGLAEIGGEAETPGFALTFREAGETHYGNIHEPRIGQLEPPELRSVHPRHLQVENDETGTLAGSKELEGVFPVPRGQRTIALFLDHLAENREELAVVVHDENRLPRLDRRAGHRRNRNPRKRRGDRSHGPAPATEFTRGQVPRTCTRHRIYAGTGPTDLHPPPKWIGEPRRTRTFNLEIKSLLLYQLS